jgi:hypothetical protein
VTVQMSGWELEKELGQLWEMAFGQLQKALELK